MTAYCKVEVSFDGTSKTVGTWTDISASVMGCSFTGGKRTLNGGWGPGTATIQLEDGERTYDPSNTDSMYSPDLRGGKQIKIVVSHPTYTGKTRTWRGIVKGFYPTVWGGDSLGITEIKASDLLIVTNVATPFFADDFITEKMSKAQEGFHYNFDEIDSLTGSVKDISGKGAVGISYTNEYAGTIGMTQTTPGLIDSDANSSIIVPMKSDFLRESPGGFFGVFRFVYDGNQSFVGSNEEVGDGVLMSEGYYEVSPHTTFTALDYTNFGLSRFMFGTAPAGSDAIFMQFRSTKASSSVAFVVNEVSGNIGSATFYEGEDIIFIVSLDQFTLEMRTIIVGGLGLATLSADSPLKGVNSSALNTRKEHDEEAELLRLGQGMPSWATGTRAPWNGFYGSMNFAAMGYVGASAEWIDGLVDNIQNGLGFISNGSLNRITDLLTAVDLDLSYWSIDVTSKTKYNEALPIGGVNMLGLLQQHIVTEQGRIFQTSGGVMKFQDFDAAAAATDTVPVAVYTDGSGTALVAGTNGSYLDGSFRMDASTDRIINHVQVEVSRLGFKTFRHDHTSIDELGHHLEPFELPVQRDVAAGRFAELMLERYKDYRLAVRSVKIDPDTDPNFWWDHLMDIEIGQKVTLERRPLNRGSIVSIDSALNGYQWDFSAMEGWTITEYFSPATDWANTINITENDALGDSVTIKKPYGVEVGDLLVIIAAMNHSGSGASDFFAAPPTGFTANDEVGSTTSDCRFQVFYRIADGTETATETIDTVGAVTSVWMVGAYIKMPGMDQTTPFDGESAETLTAAVVTGVVAAVTPTQADCRVMSIAAINNSQVGRVSYTGTDWGENIPVPSRQLLKAGVGVTGITLMFDSFIWPTATAVSTNNFNWQVSGNFCSEAIAFRQA